MSTQRSQSIPCPACRRSLRLTMAALLQARQFGVSCQCPNCQFEWMYHAPPGIADPGNRPPHFTSPHRSSEPASVSTGSSTETSGI